MAPPLGPMAPPVTHIEAVLIFQGKADAYFSETLLAHVRHERYECYSKANDLRLFALLLTHRQLPPKYHR